MLNLFNREVMPTWRNYSGIIIAPAAGGVLASYPTTQIQTWIYGFFIACTEVNNFVVKWVYCGNDFVRFVPFGGLGYSEQIDYVPLNEGYPADNRSVISITVVNAGNAGQQYQAGLMIAEANTGVRS